jgi:hypothetical protein
MAGRSIGKHDNERKNKPRNVSYGKFVVHVLCMFLLSPIIEAKGLSVYLGGPLHYG